MAAVPGHRMTPDVLLLTPTWGGHDGLSLLAAQYANALAEIADGGLEVWAFVDRTPPGAAPPPGRLRAFRGRRSALGRAAIAAALDRRPRLVVTLHVNQLGVAAPLVAAGVPLAHVLVGIEAWTPLRGLRAAVLRRAARLLAISAHTRDRFLEANAPQASGVTVVHPHTPIAATPDSDQPAPPGYALVVGRMSAQERYKGHDALIDCWPSVQAQVPGARLLCVGDGDDAPRLRGRVIERGLNASIAFAGHVPPSRLAALYRDCAFLVLPSPHEGFGFVFLEAMAAGRACIGAPGAAQEIIRHGETGLIAAPGTDALPQALVALFGDRTRRESMGAAGRVRADTVFAREAFVQRLHGALDRHFAPC